MNRKLVVLAVVSLLGCQLKAEETKAAETKAVTTPAATKSAVTKSAATKAVTTPAATKSAATKAAEAKAVEAKPAETKVPDKIVKSDDQWKKSLSPSQFCIMRQKGTETPFNNKYDSFFKPGTYECAACGNKLFSSNSKYDSHTGWPAFFRPISKESIKVLQDNSLGMERTEVLCAKCESHLGHVFLDGPKPSGLHFCINSECLNFIPDPANTTTKK
jgi:peptide-methionine (R)-S-oxide reductase